MLLDTTKPGIRVLSKNDNFFVEFRPLSMLMQEMKTF